MKENRDRYLGFTYNGKSMNMTAEADFFGFIENSGNELSFFNSPDFSNEFVVPQFGDRTFYTGNTKNNRTFSLKVQLDKITLHKYREFLEWLSPDSEGLLVFDYNPNYGYQVKLQSISDSEFHVTKRRNNNEDFYYVDLNLNFITTYDYAAQWVKKPVAYTGSSEDNLIDNEFYEDFIEVAGNNFKIYNYHNLVNYFTIDFDNQLTIVSPVNPPVTLVTITGAGTNAKYFSEFGIALKSDGSFLNCGSGDPIIPISPRSDIALTITTSGSGSKINSIVPSSREVI